MKTHRQTRRQRIHRRLRRAWLGAGALGLVPALALAQLADPIRTETGLVAGPTYDEAPRSFMVLGESIGPRVIPTDPARRAFFEGLPGNE